MSSIKLEAIKSVIMNYNFEGDWKVKDVKEKIRLLIGENVGMQIQYMKDAKINEVLGKAEEITVIDKISITFTDVDDKIKTVDFNYNSNSNDNI